MAFSHFFECFNIYRLTIEIPPPPHQHVIRSSLEEKRREGLNHDAFDVAEQLHKEKQIVLQHSRDAEAAAEAARQRSEKRKIAAVMEALDVKEKARWDSKLEEFEHHVAEQQEDLATRHEREVEEFEAAQERYKANFKFRHSSTVRDGLRQIGLLTSQHHYREAQTLTKRIQALKVSELKSMRSKLVKTVQDRRAHLLERHDAEVRSLQAKQKNHRLRLQASCDRSRVELVQRQKNLISDLHHAHVMEFVGPRDLVGRQDRPSMETNGATYFGSILETQLARANHEETLKKASSRTSPTKKRSKKRSKKRAGSTTKPPSSPTQAPSKYILPSLCNLYDI